MTGGDDLARALEQAIDQHGRSLAALCDERPMLVVFLRHGGCTFCRQVLSDLARQRRELEGRGLGITLVHMDPTPAADELIERHGLGGLSRVADPRRCLYQAFDLGRAASGQLLSPRVWWRGLVCCILRGHGMGRFRGDVRQLPGSFVVYRRRIVSAHRPNTPADRPDFCIIVG